MDSSQTARGHKLALGESLRPENRAGFFTANGDQEWNCPEHGKQKKGHNFLWQWTSIFGHTFSHFSRVSGQPRWFRMFLRMGVFSTLRQRDQVEQHMPHTTPRLKQVFGAGFGSARARVTHLARWDMEMLRQPAGWIGSLHLLLQNPEQ